MPRPIRPTPWNGPPMAAAASSASLVASMPRNNSRPMVRLMSHRKARLPSLRSAGYQKMPRNTGMTPT